MPLQWGSKHGIPVLFVHGGPGNCVADYQNVNERFFDASVFFVVEVDQRGTGKSQPSVRSPQLPGSFHSLLASSLSSIARPQVRDDFKHMQRYRDISIAQMSADFEKVREHLQISQWLIFGGSWGSTLGLDYAQRYASVCLGLIIRGIYLNSKPEFDAIYSRSPFLADARRLAEFDTWQELAVAEAKLNGEPEL